METRAWIWCLQLPYVSPWLAVQGLDWYALKALACNNGQNPIQNSFYDGINVDPLEVMFIKVSFGRMFC